MPSGPLGNRNIEAARAMSVRHAFLPLLRRHLPGLFLSFVLGGTAMAAEPWGEWLVAEKTARIRIADCAGTLWGFVSWEADPGLDSKNPDPAKRTRPTLGMPILLGMKAGGKDRWDGRIYNSENGKF